jgi:hypothetical protein
MTAFFSGFDVNDTNTSVNLFQTNEGAIPSTIQAAALLGSSKMGLWAWIRGNVVTSGQPTPPPACGSGLSGLLDCMIPQWVASLCSNPTASCINTSGLIWAGGLAIFFSFFTVRGLGEMLPGQKYPIGEIFMFWALVWIFVMSGLSQVFAWVPIFFFFLISLFVGKKTGVYL